MHFLILKRFLYKDLTISLQICVKKCILWSIRHLYIWYQIVMFIKFYIRKKKNWNWSKQRTTELVALKKGNQLTNNNKINTPFSSVNYLYTLKKNPHLPWAWRSNRFIHPAILGRQSAHKREVFSFDHVDEGKTRLRHLDKTTSSSK